jgi:hypothetical protein
MNRGEYKQYQEKSISFGTNNKRGAEGKECERKRLPRENKEGKCG